MQALSITDLHSHLIPAVDDGARDASDARGAIRILASDGVTRIVTTPHVRASVLTDPAARSRRLTQLDMGWALLLRARGELPEDAPVIERGIELMLDAPDPDLSDERLRLAGGPAVLVEFPFMRIPVYATEQLEWLAREGWTPVVAHVERYDNLELSLREVSRWREVGALLQLNAGSFLGRYGKAPRRRAWGLLGTGWVSLLASDYHARSAPPVLREAWRRIAGGGRVAEGRGRGGGRADRTGRVRTGPGAAEGPVEAALRLLLEQNPRRIVEGKRPLPVPPLAEKPAWRRWLGIG